MVRRVGLLVGLGLLAATAADVASRGLLLGALVERAPAAAPAPPVSAAPPATTPSDPPRLTTFETAKLSGVASVPAGGCASDAWCTVTLTLQPAPGLHFSQERPQMFIPRAGAQGLEVTKTRPSNKALDRVVIDVPVRVVGAGPRVLEGRVSTVTCNVEVCSFERVEIAVPLS